MALSVTCPSCGKSFQLAQEIYERKVAGKIVSIRCKQCQSGIRIDATQPGGLKVIGATPAGETGTQAVRPRQPTLIGMMGPGGTVATVGDAGALWAVDSGGTGEDREIDDETITRDIAAGLIGATTLVWRDGMGDWLEVQQVPQLAQHLPVAKKAAEPVKVAAPLPAARQKQPSAPDVAPAPARAKQASAPEIAAPAAVQPKAPAAVEAKPPAPIEPKAAHATTGAQTPAARAAASLGKTAARPSGLAGVPVMHEEDDEDEATMIFRTSGEAASKLGLGELPQEKTPVPAAPPPAAGRPAGAAGVAGLGAPRPAAGRPGSSPIAAPAAAAGRPAAPSALGAKPGLGARPGSSPLAATAPAAPRALATAAAARPGSSPIAAPTPSPSPAAAVPPVAPVVAPAPPAAAAAPAPAAPPAAAAPPPPPAPPPPAPPPPRAKQPSAPGLPRGLTPPPERRSSPLVTSAPSLEPEADAAAPMPPSPPPPPPAPAGSSAPFPTAPAAPAPMRARQPSAPGFPKGLYPPPERPAPPPPSPPPAPPSSPPAFVPTQNPFAGGGPASPSAQMAQLAPNPFAVATTTDLEFKPSRSKTPLVIGALVLVLAAAGIAVAVTNSGSHPAPPPVPAAPPAPPPTDTVVTPSAATSEATAAPETPPPPGKPQDNIAGTPRPSASNGDFSQMFAAGAQQAQKGSSSGTKAFDAEAARTAVAGVLKSVAACKEPGGPTGQASAAITFAPDGHVSSVTVGAPFSGTSTGTCIIGAFKAAKIPAFSGLPGTVAQPVSLL
jgi:hypothetical protein